MLLEYNADTDEAQLHERAITLRQRVAGRKLQELVDAGSLSADDLLQLKEANRDQTREHFGDSINIAVAELHDRLAFDRAEQHLRAEGQVRTLGKDVSRAARLGKAKVDSLNDLERRIMAMRAKLQNSISQPVEVEISNELRTNNKAVKLEKQFKICGFCQRRILVQLLETHEKNCRVRLQSTTSPDEEEMHKKELFNTAVTSLDANIITSLSTFPPQPPRHCRVASKGVTFITWEWEPPIVDGGLCITEYEISYLARYCEFDVKTGRYRRWEEDVPSLPTSTWIFRANPVCHTGFKLTQLRANSEYTHFRIRCYNLRGWSAWTNMMDSFEDRVMTDAAVPPTPPLFVHLEKITSSCMHLTWQLPYFDGGLPITEYVICYSYIEKQVTVMDRDVRVEHHKSFSIQDPTATYGVIRNLPENTEVYNVYICAVNLAGLQGAQGMLRPQVNFTKDCSRHMKLTRELEKTAAATEDYIDSAFFTGVKQRYIRVEHMRRLQQELSITPPDPLELEEAKEWAAVKELKLQRHREEQQALQQQKTLMEKKNLGGHDSDEDQEQDDEKKVGANGSPRKETAQTGRLLFSKSSPSSPKKKSGQSSGDDFSFTVAQRRAHFGRKIHQLELKRTALQQERYSIDRQRIAQTLSMRSQEQHLTRLNLENERLKHFHSSVITSNVLSGAEMQYNTVDYRIRVDKELHRVIQEIAQLKYTIITQENRRQIIKKQLVEIEEALKDRLAKCKQFESQMIRRQRLMARFGNLGEPMALPPEEKQRIYKMVWQEWQEFRYQRQDMRRRIVDMFTDVMKRYLRSAFVRWATGHFPSTSSLSLALSSATGARLPGGSPSRHLDVSRSRADVMLVQAQHKRFELQDALRLAMTQTQGLHQKLQLLSLSKEKVVKLTQQNPYYKTMEEGIDGRGLYQRGAKLLLEGDGYVQAGKYPQAISTYEGQIMLTRSHAPVDIKLLALCHGRLGRTFLSLFQGQRALIDFDRQLSLAREIDDRCEESDAYYGLGVGYLSLADYENAIRYLTIAQAQYLTLGRYSRHLAALGKLKECYDKLNRPDKVQAMEVKLREVQEAIPQRVAALHDRYDNMRNRLAYTAAEMELVVVLERLSVRGMQLRTEIEELNSQLAVEEDRERDQEEVTHQVQDLIAKIKDELDRATASDEPELYTALVHDQPQVVEIEELKTRLRQRGKQEYERLVLEEQALHRIRVKIKNMEHMVRDKEQELSLENGALMKTTKLHKSFRLVALCAANAAGNEVTGTATGGYEEFAASEGCHIHLLDYHNGSLNAILLGGESSKGHVGTITALLHDGSFLFSGGSDEKIIAWETAARSYHHCFLGHEGSIVALAVEAKLLLSSAADVTMRLWDKQTGEGLRVLFGHSKSVLCVEIGSSWCLSGSADQEVRVWRIARHNKSYQVESTHRLIGHTAPVTCARYGSVEVVSGDRSGVIIIWWLKTGTILRQCNVHTGPVRALQFDSVHIVSGGRDACVAITDIATGEVLQSLRGHTETILAVAFDSERIVSIGGDNVLRYWQWGRRSGPPADKLHVLEERQSLVSVAQRYQLPLDDLMRWNGIRDAKQVYPGMKLIVKKGDPTAPSPAERVQQERAQQQKSQHLQMSQKLIKLTQVHDQDGGLGDTAEDRISSMGSSLLNQQVSRVAKIAMDIDPFSLANRLAGQARRDMELFPLDPSLSTDKYSLATRLQHDLEQREEGRGRRPGASGPSSSQEGSSASKAGFYYICAGNEDEWGEAADHLGEVMLTCMVELMAYEVVLEQKKQLRSRQSVIGRIFLYEKEKEQRRAALEGIIEDEEEGEEEDEERGERAVVVREGEGKAGEGKEGEAQEKGEEKPRHKRRKARTAPDATDGPPLLTKEMWKAQVQEEHRKRIMREQSRRAMSKRLEISSAASDEPLESLEDLPEPRQVIGRREKKDSSQASRAGKSPSLAASEEPTAQQRPMWRQVSDSEPMEEMAVIEHSILSDKELRILQEEAERQEERLAAQARRNQEQRLKQEQATAADDKASSRPSSIPTLPKIV